MTDLRPITLQTSMRFSFGGTQRLPLFPNSIRQLDSNRAAGPE